MLLYMSLAIGVQFRKQRRVTDTGDRHGGSAWFDSVRKVTLKFEERRASLSFRLFDFMKQIASFV